AGIGFDRLALKGAIGRALPLAGIRIVASRGPKATLAARSSVVTFDLAGVDNESASLFLVGDGGGMFARRELPNYGDDPPRSCRANARKCGMGYPRGWFGPAPHRNDDCGGRSGDR